MDLSEKKTFFFQMSLAWKKVIIENIADILKVDKAVFDEQFPYYQERYEYPEDGNYYETNLNINSYNLQEAIKDQIECFHNNSCYETNTVFYNDYFFSAFVKLKVIKVEEKNLLYEDARFIQLSENFNKIRLAEYNISRYISFSDFKRFYALNEYLGKIEPERENYKFYKLIGHDFERIIDRGICEKLYENQMYELFKNVLRLNENLENLDALLLFENIEEILLPACNIYDISAIDKLQYLTKLNLFNNPIVILPKSAVTKHLRDVDLQNTNLPSLEWLRECKLINKLNISENTLLDLEILKKLKGLRYLNISNCKVLNSYALSEIKKLKTLYLFGTKIESFLPISNLTKLKDLYISNIGIEEFTGLDRLINLINLSLSGNKITKIANLDALVNLEKIDLSYCNIKNANFLKSCTHLRRINISQNKLSNIDFLKNLTKLNWLDISNNMITSLEGLSKMDSLSWFDCGNNLLKKLNGLETSINKLENIRFRGMTIESLWPIMEFGNNPETWVEYPNTKILDSESENKFISSHDSINIDNDRTRKDDVAFSNNYDDHCDNPDYDRDTFDAMTDGHLGDWDDFDGDIDDVMTWAGR